MVISEADVTVGSEAAIRAKPELKMWAKSRHLGVLNNQRLYARVI